MLLDRLRLPYEVCTPEVEEHARPGEASLATAARLAEEKARNVAHRYPAALIIGSDQVLDCNGSQFGKPGTRQCAVKQLKLLRGNTVIFHTALALLNTETQHLQHRVVPTEVVLRNYTDNAIEHYLDHEDALGCAGSAKSEGLGAALIARMTSDDPTALIGLPLLALIDMLALEGVEILE